MKKYEFKSKGKTPEKSQHVIEYGHGCNLQVILLWKLIHVYNCTLDKKIFSDYCDKLESFIEEQQKLNQRDEYIIEHYNSIDMGMELLLKFLILKFGDNIKNYEE